MVVNRESARSLREVHRSALDAPGLAGILSCLLRVSSLGAVLYGSCDVALSQTQQGASSAERCLAANLDPSLGAQLPRTAARLKSGEPLKIVAIGSSSTVGLWVLAHEATYPEVMRRELSRLRSTTTRELTNSGRVADTTPDHTARFARQVLAQPPALVVW